MGKASVGFERSLILFLFIGLKFYKCKIALQTEKKGDGYTLKKTRVYLFSKIIAG
jgi:hypothetical protein